MLFSVIVQRFSGLKRYISVGENTVTGPHEINAYPLVFLNCRLELLFLKYFLYFVASQCLLFSFHHTFLFTLEILQCVYV